MFNLLLYKTFLGPTDLDDAQEKEEGKKKEVEGKCCLLILPHLFHIAVILYIQESA